MVSQWIQIPEETYSSARVEFHNQQEPNTPALHTISKMFVECHRQRIKSATRFSFLLFDLFSFGSKENKLKEKLGETFPLLGFSLVTVVDDGGGGNLLEVLYLILTKSGITDTLAVIKIKQHLESQTRMRVSYHGLHHDILSSETPQCYNLPKGLPLCMMATAEDIRIPCVESTLRI